MLAGGVRSHILALILQHINEFYTPADGSIHDLLDVVSAHSAIHIAPGNHFLPRSLLLDRPVELYGDHADNRPQLISAIGPCVESHSPEAVLRHLVLRRPCFAERRPSDGGAACAVKSGSLVAVSCDFCRPFFEVVTGDRVMHICG